MPAGGCQRLGHQLGSQVIGGCPADYAQGGDVDDRPVDDELIRRNPCRVKGADRYDVPERPVLYPGAKVLPASEATRRWTQAVGIDFHEVRIETNAHRLTLLFSDLQVSEVPDGYAPFVTE
ncbi:hypothetical protein ACIBCU_31285 [Streptomyces sp. NPDC051064]|uniref:YxiG-like protein n=1 Tax=Streptomyces sp. NPDC051064 TaxID=3365641 RepID=UPI00378BE0DD